jgi:thiamine biosynthesis lipoprotein
MGEIRTIGTRPEGAPWRVGLADPVRPGVLTKTVDLIGRAVATSAGAEFRFDPKDRFTHLFDPVTGRSPSLYSTVSVVVPTATEADALSTAFSLRPLPQIRGVVTVLRTAQAHIIEAGGTVIIGGA